MLIHELLRWKFSWILTFRVLERKLHKLSALHNDSLIAMHRYNDWLDRGWNIE